MRVKENGAIQCNFENLPKDSYGNIKWIESVGLNVPFTYNNISGNIKIVEYKKENKLKIEYKNYTHTLITSSFKYGNFINFLKRVENIKSIRGGLLYETLNVTDPWIEKYFQEQDKYYFYELSKGSGFKLNFICPICGTITKKKSIYNVVKAHDICCHRCCDHMSYPNKFGYALFCFLEDNKIIDSYEYEYYPKWVKPYHYKYDHYFKYNNIEYIVEFDGELGHGKKVFGKKRDEATDTKGLKRDKHKNVLAQQNNVILIRIDATKSDFEFLKEQCINMIPIIRDHVGIIDWISVEANCQKNLYKEINDYYLSMENPSISKIAKHFKTNVQTIINVLKTYYKLGLNDYRTFLDKYNEKYTQVINMFNSGISILQIVEETGIQRQSVNNYLKTGTEKGECNYTPYKNNKVIEVFKDGKSYGKYISMSELSRKSLNDLGVHLDISHISYACSGRVSSAKGYTFKVLNNNNERED